MKQSPLKLHQKNKKQTKNLGINLTKAVKDLHAENCKTLITEIEDDSKRNGNMIPSLGLEEYC